jgi:hypothetical protein
LDYIGALLLSGDQEQATLAAIHRALQVVEAVGERYRQQKDLLSLVLLYESAQVGLERPHVMFVEAGQVYAGRSARTAEVHIADLPLCCGLSCQEELQTQRRETG